MDGVTKVVLQGLELDCLIPGYVAQCTNLRELHLQNCSPADWLDTMAIPFFLPTCTSLTHLVLDCTNLLEQPQEVVEQQLAKLPGLSNVSWHETKVSHMGALTVLGTQLTALSFTPILYPVQFDTRLKRFANGCPNLTQLSLSDLWVEDAEMKQLLRMTSLTHLTVYGFDCQSNPTADYSSRPCSWKRLMLTCFNVDDMDRIPLHGITHIGLFSHRSGNCGVFNGDGKMKEAEVRSVVAKLMHCGGLHCDQAREVSINDCRGATCLVPLLQAIGRLPLQLSITKEHITSAVVAAMGRHLTGPGLQQICFDRCTFDANVFSILLPSLPPVPTVELRNLSQVPRMPTEAQVREVCMNAVRPVRLAVCVYDVSTLGWTQTEMTNQLKQAGQQLVCVSCFQRPKDEPAAEMDYEDDDGEDESSDGWDNVNDD